MNIILFDQSDYYQGKDIIRLSDYRFDHISKVIKAKTNDPLKTGLINGNWGTGKVLEINNQFIDILVNLDRTPPSPSPLTLLLALPRPKILKRTLKHITTIGVKNIYLILLFIIFF